MYKIKFLSYICFYLQVTSTENKSLVNVPLTVVGNTLYLLHTNPFSSTFNYTNIPTNYVSTNSPLNDESPTFSAFFMSEMERMSTVRTITEMDLRWVVYKCLLIINIIINNHLLKSFTRLKKIFIIKTYSKDNTII